VMRLPDRFRAAERDAVLGYMAARGIECGRYFAPVHQQPLYAARADRAYDLPVTEQSAQRMLALPFFNHLKDEEIAEVCESLRQALRGV
jgi:perosamine synthetase